MCVLLWLAGREKFINLPTCMCANNLDLYFQKKTSLYSTCNIAESDKGCEKRRRRSDLL